MPRNLRNSFINATTKFCKKKNCILIKAHFDAFNKPQLLERSALPKLFKFQCPLFSNTGNLNINFPGLQHDHTYPFDDLQDDSPLEVHLKGEHRGVSENSAQAWLLQLCLSTAITWLRMRVVSWLLQQHSELKSISTRCSVSWRPFSDSHTTTCSSRNCTAGFLLVVSACCSSLPWSPSTSTND